MKKLASHLDREYACQEQSLHDRAWNLPIIISRESHVNNVAVVDMPGDRMAGLRLLLDRWEERNRALGVAVQQSRENLVEMGRLVGRMHSLTRRNR